MSDKYRSQEGALAYRDKYARSWTRRLSSRRELFLASRSLERFGPIDRLLDCPCGAGRLLKALVRRARHVTEADGSLEMLRLARQAGATACLRAFAQRLPFADRAFDVAVCHRLVQHLHTAPERARLFGELARVSRRGVVLSFADAGTRKARRRRAAGSRVALDATALEAEAAACGLVRVGSVLRIGGWFSWLAVAAFEKRPLAVGR